MEKVLTDNQIVMIGRIKDNHRLYCLTCPDKCETRERQIKAIEDGK